MTDVPRETAHAQRVVARLAEDTPVATADRGDLATLLDAVRAYIDAQHIPFGAERELAAAAHCLAFVRRVREREYLPELNQELYREVDESLLTGARELLGNHCVGVDYIPADAEALLLALHFETARQEQSAATHQQSSRS